MQLIFTGDQNESLARIAEIFSLPIKDVVSMFQDFMFAEEQKRFLVIEMQDNKKIYVPHERWVSALSIFCDKVIKPMFKPVYEAILAEKKKGKNNNE